MKRCLTNTIYRGPELVPVRPRGIIRRGAVKALAAAGLVLTRSRPMAQERRSQGLDNNPGAHTMIGLERLTNIQRCVQSVLDERIPGDLLEAGVWRGGATAFMRAILKANGVQDRIVWVADSFEGLPEPDEHRYPQDKGDTHHTYEWLAISMEEVKETFRTYDLLDDQVRFLKGWFKDSLPTAPIDRLAVVRLDGDMYQSTMEALVNLYPKLSIGGYIILDDWGFIPACRQAIDDYRSQHGITELIRPVDGNAGCWRRER
ncbi:MAG: TylF/MycF family methyltransferase [Pseudomonadota bacterium]|nr:TylF/MycF family methyltransferase [Pseudomonadota bacterium]